MLYPNDATEYGKELRLKQQFFFVSASLQVLFQPAALCCLIAERAPVITQPPASCRSFLRLPLSDFSAMRQQHLYPVAFATQDREGSSKEVQWKHAVYKGCVICSGTQGRVHI